MDQGWKRFPSLVVVFLLLWQNADGFTYGTYPDANHWWGQPSDNTFSPHAVQSSMPETHMTGILPEEVDSSLLSNRPLESRSKNLHQFVKGSVSSSSESTSNVQMAPSPPVSSVVSQPVDQLYVASLSSPQRSSEFSFTDSVGGLMGSPFRGSYGQELSVSSKQPFSTQVGGDSFSDVSQSLSALNQYNPESFMNNKLGDLSLVASSQPTSAQSLPSVSLSNTQSRSDTQSAIGPIISSLGGSYASGLLPQAQATCQSKFGYSKHVSSPKVISSHLASAPSSVHASSATSFYPSASLSLPQGVASQSSDVQNSKQFTFTDNTDAHIGSSGPLSFQGSTYGGSLQPQEIAGMFAPGSPTYSSFSLPQDVGSQSATLKSTSKQASVSAPFTLLERSIYSGPLQAQGMTSDLALGYPSSGTPGSSAFLAFQGSTGFRQLPYTQDASRSSSPYTSASLPDDVTSQYTPGQSTSKWFTSDYGTQAGHSAPFGLLKGPTYSGPHQAQSTTNQLALGYPPSSSASLLSPQAVASHSSTVHDLRKQYTLKGSSGTSPGFSAPLTFQGSTGFVQLPKTQDASRSSSSYTSESLAQDVTSQFTTGPSTTKGFTSNYGTQTRPSTLFTLLGSNTYSRPLQAQGTTSQLALGYPLSSSASLYSPQGVASLSSVHGARQQFSFTDSSGTQAGSSARIIVKGSTDYGGSPQPKKTANTATSPLAPGSLSYPSAFSQGFVSKPFSSGYGTQTESSRRLNLHGGTTSDGSPQSQDTPSLYAPVSLYPSESLDDGFPSRSTTEPISSKHRIPLEAQVTSQLALGYPSSSRALLSSPQDIISQSPKRQGSRKQFTSTGSSGTPAGTFVSLASQGTTGYGQSHKPQDAFRKSPYASVSLPQDVTSQSTTIQNSKKQFTSSYGSQAGSSTPFTLQKGTGYSGSPQPQHATNPLAPGSLSYQSISLPQGLVSKQFASGHGTQTGSSTPLIQQGCTTSGESPQPLDTAIHFSPESPSYQSASLPQGFLSKSTTASSTKGFTKGYGTHAGSSVPLTLQKGTACAGSFQTQDTTSQFAPGTFSSSNVLIPQGVGSQSTTVQGSHKQFSSSYGTQTGSTAPFNLHGSTSFGESPQPHDSKSQFPLCASASFPQDVTDQSKFLQNSQKQITFTGGSDTQAGTSAFFNVHENANYGLPQTQVTTSQFAHRSPSYPSVSLSSPQNVASHWKQNIQSIGVAPLQANAMGDLSPGVSGQSASAPLTGCGSSSLQYPGHSTKYSTRFPSNANPGSSILSVTSQFTSDQSSAGLSRQQRPGTQLDPSSFYISVQDGASSTEGSAVQRVSSQFAPGLSSQNAKVPASSPYREAVPSGSSPFRTQLFQKWQPASSR